MEDPSIGDAEKIARFEALADGGEVIFAQPLAVIVSDAILVEHRPPDLSSKSRFAGNVVVEARAELKVDLVRGDGHIDADRVVA